MAWRYRLQSRYERLAPELMGVEFSNRWLEIRHCRLAIAEGYAWDGCSPAFKLSGGFWAGPWDGPLMADGRPATWRASLVHDALCQYRAEIQGLTKAATVRLFAKMLREGEAPDWICSLYPAAVDRFGPQVWGGVSA